MLKYTVVQFDLRGLQMCSQEYRPSVLVENLGGSKPIWNIILKVIAKNWVRNIWICLAHEKSM
jgi:hypothetical protein